MQAYIRKSLILLSFFLFSFMVNGFSQVTKQEVLQYLEATYDHEMDQPQVDSIEYRHAEFSPYLLKDAQATLDAYAVSSPDNSIKVNIELTTDQLTYSISKRDVPMVTPSVLNLQLAGGDLTKGIICEETERNEVNENIHLPYGEKQEVSNNYKEVVLHCRNGRNESFHVCFRAYNEGVAFRFSFPETNTLQRVEVKNEITQFAFSDTYTAYVEAGNENGYTQKSLNNVYKTLIPLTLKGTQSSICINEAGNDDYARICLRGISNNTLQSSFLGSPSSYSLPYALPWRYLVIGDDPVDLIYKKEMIYGLNKYQFNEKDWSWLKPGKVFRSLVLTTQGGKDAIDFCHVMNIQYMMFDAGWYGLGYGQSRERDPLSDPMDVIDGLDMMEITRYATEKGVGVILYINKVGWDRYDNQAMFDLYESWGIKGVKLGFMDGYSSYGNKKIYTIIDEAARRKMVVNVHDNLRPTGLTLKHPNLMTAEGIRGNEHIENTGDHTTLLPFTRYLTGAGDYTICYKGNDPDYNRKPRLMKTSRAHQLALSVLFYSPLQHIFWYGAPYIYQTPVEIEMFKQLPTVWDDFKVTTAEMGHYFSMARKKGDNWYLAAISDNTARDIYIPLDFLDAATKYKVTIYSDKEPETINRRRVTLEQLKTEGMVTDKGLFTSMQASGGVVCVFKPENSNPVIEAEWAQAIKVFPNPTTGRVTIQSDQLAGKEVNVVVTALDGQQVYSKNGIRLADGAELDLCGLSNGMYILTLKTPDAKVQQKLIIRK
ncbi:T9SS C-terminal target domain-containing protein [Marinilabiliaceae bacterium JC017]|nr:T9SS C-terminal target domain-containing protein [Marinilabiliaceae bacterium JC017]